MKRVLIIVGCAIGVLALSAGTIYAASHAFDTKKTDEHEFPRHVKHVVVEADAGDVEVVPAERRVAVRETRHYVFDSPEVSRSVEDGVLTLTGECDGVLFMSCETDYRIEVPKGVTVDVRTHVGDVDVAGVAARRVEARSNVGDVEIETVRRGAVDARTNVGDVEVTVPAGTYDVDADTNVGDTDVDGVVSYDKARHDVQAQTNVGNVDVRASERRGRGR